MAATQTATDHRSVGELLWSYRRILERARYLLDAHLVLASVIPEIVWLERFHHSVDLLDEAANSLALLDAEREVLIGNANATELIETSDELWGEILVEHVVELRMIVSDLDTASGPGLEATVPRAGDASGSDAPAALLEVRSAEVGYVSLVNAMHRVLSPALHRFLR